MAKHWYIVVHNPNTTHKFWVSVITGDSPASICHDMTMRYEDGPYMPVYAEEISAQDFARMKGRY
jgi:hypothetical protein